MNLNYITFLFLLTSFIVTIFIQISFPLFSYGLLLIVIILTSYKKGLIDYRVGFLGMITLYAFLPIFNYFFYGSHDVGIGSYNSFARLEARELNLQALQYVSYFCLGICFHLLIKKNKFVNYISNMSKDSTQAPNLKQYSQRLYLSYALFGMSLLLLDWGRIRSEYTLENVSLTFFICYFIFSIFGVFIASTGRLPISKLIPLLIIMAIFSFMGTRQTIFWGIWILIISNVTYRFHYPRLFLTKSFVKSIFKYAVILLSVIMIFALTVSYRVNKDLDLIFLILGDLPLILKISFSLLLSETYYTYYNLLIVIDSSLEGHLSILSLFKDFFVQMVPRQIFPSKYTNMDFINLSRDFDLTPFGTWYVIGMIATVSIIPIVSFLLGYVYCEIINLSSILVRKITSNLGEFSALYAIIYVFCSMYSVRSTLAGGLKMAVSIFIIFILFKLLSIILREITSNKKVSGL